MISAEERALQNSIKYSRKKGVPEDMIRSELISKGNYPFMVDRALLETSKKRNGLKYAKILSSAALLSFLAIFLLQNAFSETCDEGCFLNAANSCSAAGLITEIEGGIYRLDTSDCIFTKLLIKLPDDESPAVKSFLEGRSMSCRYSPDDFDINLIKTVSIGIENCEGDLRENIGLIKESD